MDLSRSYTHLKLHTRHRHQLWLELDNPTQSNALTLPMIESLTHALIEADQDPEIRVIVLTGAGTSFCAGGDLKAMREKSGMFAGEGNELRMRYMHGIQRIPKTIEDLSKPLIALVQGPAIGAGCDLAMMCDLRVGSEKTRFAETFARLGLVPGDGGTFLLTRVVGYAKAMRMFMTGESIEGQAALDFGLMHFLHDSGELEAETIELAAKVAAQSPIALQMTKKALKLSYLHDLQSSLDLLAGFQGIAQRTQDHFEALRAFENKRPADFKGL